MTSSLMRAVAPFRRREAFVTAVSTAAFAFVAAAGVSVVLARMTGWSTSMVASAIGALAVTALATFARRGSARSIAARIDRLGGLSDRLSTALEHQDSTDPVARLLVRDAAARLARLAPADLFPLRAPAHLGKVTALAFATALFGVTAPASLFPLHAPSSPANAGSAAGASAAAEAPPQETGVEAPGTRLDPARPAAVAAKTPDPSRAEAPSATPPVKRPGKNSAPPAAAVGAGQLTSRGETAGNAAQTTKASGALSTQAASGRRVRAASVASGSAGARNVSFDGPDRSVGQQPMPPGLRAYVRTYFEAIRK